MLLMKFSELCIIVTLLEYLLNCHISWKIQGRSWETVRRREGHTQKQFQGRKADMGKSLCDVCLKQVNMKHVELEAVRLFALTLYHDRAWPACFVPLSFPVY